MDWARLFDPSYDPYAAIWDLVPVQFGYLQQVDPNTRTTMLLVAIALIGFGLSRLGGRRPQLVRQEPAFDGSLRMGLGLWRGLWWRMRPIRRKYRWQVGAYRVSTKRKHAGIVGATGSRKSSAAAELVRGDRPTLILTGEPSDPLRAATLRLAHQGRGVLWTPSGDTGWDMLQGDPMETAERLTAGTKRNEQDTGLGRGIAQDAIYHALRAADRIGQRRSWEHVDAAMDVLMQRAGRDQNMLGAAQRWKQRFAHMCLALGDALGDDLDLARALGDGQTVMMEMSSMRSPESTPLVAANILLDAKRVAQRVRGGRLLIDEGWAFRERKAEIAEVVRAGRRLDWEVYFFSQLPQDYPDEMLANFRTWLFLMQVGTNTAALEWCSRAVHRKLPPEAFAEGVLKEGDGWLLTDGRLVKVHIPWRRLPELADEDDLVLDPRWATGGEGNEPGRVEVAPWEEPGPWAGTVEEQIEEQGRLEPRVNGAVMLPGPRREAPGYVAGRERREQIWGRLRGTWNPSGCHLWPEDAGRNKAYGKTSYLNRSGWETHFLFWAWRVMEDHKLGRRGDLEVFYARHPDVLRFDWPASGSELVVLLELKTWMRTWMEGVLGRHEKTMELSIDHRCPGFPNPLCGNAGRDASGGSDSHLWLVTAGENSRLRHSRRNGAGRLEAERQVAS